jgi:superfamily II DNA or RNA helicase
MFELRPPQIDVKNQITAMYLSGMKKILVSAPTGFGKTILAYNICQGAQAKKSHVLFTAHRIQLAEQTYEKFKSLKPSFLQGSSDGYDHSAFIQVATLQTLQNREIETPDIVIIDETHYAYESALVQSLFEKFPKALFIGLSATPVGSDGYLLEGFDGIVDTYQTGDLIKLGWLVPFKVFAPITPNLALVKIVSGEYEEKGLIEAIKKDDITSSSVDKYIELGEKRKFVCFAVNQAHAEEIKNEFLTRGINTEVIISSTTKEERRRYLADFKKGKIQGLISIEILTAGFDEPSVSCVILMCPTKSWRKYIQCCGRGIRLDGLSYEESVLNGKSDCLLLDCSGAVEEHGMPDERKVFKFKKKISKVLDREAGIDENTEDRKEKLQAIPEEKQIFLKQIGSVLDLYDGKIYEKESDLQEDINKFLKKTDYFWYRQNSGKAYIEGRWVHFTNKAGLPDNKVYYRNTSFSFWLELKIPKGRLTDHQKITLPEMTEAKILFFICESVFDAYKAIEHIERHLLQTEEGLLIKNTIYDLDERQTALRSKLKIPMYAK